MAAKGATNVKVCCRFRPVNKLEQVSNAALCVALEEDGRRFILHDETAGKHEFTFDAVFGSDSKQQQVYEAAALPLVQDALQGYNCTVFVYGQTGSGKTHTMIGPHENGVFLDAADRGIIPRIVDDVFYAMRTVEGAVEFSAKVAYVEIYMEKVRDLLCPAKDNLKIREDAGRGVWLDGVTEEYAGSAAEMMDIMRRGAANRAIASTRMNQDSSRSHAVFSIILTQKNLHNQSTKCGKLFLVDLAGSEMVNKTGATGQTLAEAKTINKSLSALGNVIKALTEDQQHIPYRDSKLTRLLQDSLGGNSKTSLIITASPAAYNRNETLSTARFGMRAKTIKNKPHVNVERSTAEYKKLVAQLQQQIDAQNAIIQQLQRGQGVGTPVAVAAGSFNTEQAEMLVSLQEQLDERNRDVETLQEQVAELERDQIDERQRADELAATTQALEEQLQQLQWARDAQDREMSELRSQLSRATFEKEEQATLVQQARSEVDLLRNKLDRLTVPPPRGSPLPTSGLGSPAAKNAGDRVMAADYAELAETLAREREAAAILLQVHPDKAASQAYTLHRELASTKTALETTKQEFANVVNQRDALAAQTRLQTQHIKMLEESMHDLHSQQRLIITRFEEALERALAEANRYKGALSDLMSAAKPAAKDATSPTHSASHIASDRSVDGPTTPGSNSGPRIVKMVRSFHDGYLPPSARGESKFMDDEDSSDLTSLGLPSFTSPLQMPSVHTPGSGSHGRRQSEPGLGTPTSDEKARVKSPSLLKRLTNFARRQSHDGSTSFK